MHPGCTTEPAQSQHKASTAMATRSRKEKVRQRQRLYMAAHVSQAAGVTLSSAPGREGQTWRRLEDGSL
jgi:hypothetical protein